MGYISIFSLKKITLILLLLSVSYSFAQDKLQEDSISTCSRIFTKKNISVAAVSTVYISSLYDAYKIWWEDDKRPFTFQKRVDWFGPYNDLGIDKLGHMYTSYFFYKVQRDIFLWGGFEPNQAKWMAGGLSFAMALIIEVGDGFSRYGFDYQDLTFNSLGLAYGVLQDEIPFLQNINLKWSYYPPEGFVFPPRFSEHYDGHIYWLTFDLHNMFYSSFGKYIPQYIQPAIGYSVGNKAQLREYTLGIDINLLSLFRKSENEYLNYLGNLINLFHIPSPGIKFTETNKPEYKLFLLN